MAQHDRAGVGSGSGTSRSAAPRQVLPIVDEAIATTAAQVRGQNRAQLLRLLLAEGPLSRAELASHTGLNPGSVTRIVRELIDSGVVVEVSAPVSNEIGRVGRPSVPVDLDAEHSFMAAIHLGIQLSRVALIDLRGRIIAREILPNRSLETLPDIAARCVTAIDDLIVARGLEPRRLIGAGVGAVGWVDGATGRLIEHANGRWRDYPLRDRFRELLNVVTVIDSTIRAVTLAEWWLGAGAGTRNLLLALVGSTIEAGLIAEGQLLRGNLHAAGQLAHVVLDPSGSPCVCGARGCLTTVASNVALLERAAAQAKADPDGAFAQALGAHRREPDPFIVVARAAQGGDRTAIHMLRDRAELIGTVLANAVNLVAPECVVVAGLYAPEIELPTMERALRARAFPPLAHSLRFVPSHFGAEAALIGAGTLALRRFFSPSLKVVQQAAVKTRPVVRLADHPEAV